MQGILFQVTPLFFLDSCIFYKYFQLGNELYAIYERHVYNIKTSQLGQLTQWYHHGKHIYFHFSAYISTSFPEKTFKNRPLYGIIL
jgi:hypothetical protein